MSALRNLFKTKEDSYEWICGNDTKISRMELIGEGGFGDVHKVKIRNCHFYAIANKAVQMIFKISKQVYFLIVQRLNHHEGVCEKSCSFGWQGFASRYQQ